MRAQLFPIQAWNDLNLPLSQECVPNWLSVFTFVFFHIMQAIRHNDLMSYAITATILQLIFKWKFHNNIVALLLV